MKDWRKLINDTFKKHHVYVVTFVGGEPLMVKMLLRYFVMKCQEEFVWLQMELIL